jgi:hypothetical protein
MKRGVFGGFQARRSLSRKAARETTGFFFAAPRLCERHGFFQGFSAGGPAAATLKPSEKT